MELHGVSWEKLDSSDGDLGTAESGVTKTTTVMAGLRSLMVVLGLMVVGVTNITAQFPPSNPGPVLAQLPAVNPLTEVSEMVVRATPTTLELSPPALLVGAELLAVDTLSTQMVEGGALVALVSLPERIPGIGPVGLAVRAELQQVISLTALITPPAFSPYRGTGGSLGLHCAGRSCKYKD